MVYALTLLAQAGAPEEKGAPSPWGPIGGMLPIIIIFALFFFVIVLPAQRREKKQREALFSNLKKNDEVVTNAGIIGVVQSIKENGDEVTLKIDDNTRMRVLKSSIARILTKESPKEG